MVLLTDTQNCGMRMHRECRERFPPNRHQGKPLVSDPGMHHGTCLVHEPWCMSGSLTRGGRENIPGIPSACATCNFAYLLKDPFIVCHELGIQLPLHHRQSNHDWTIVPSLFRLMKSPGKITSLIFLLIFVAASFISTSYLISFFQFYHFIIFGSLHFWSFIILYIWEHVCQKQVSRAWYLLLTHRSSYENTHQSKALIIQMPP